MQGVWAIEREHDMSETMRALVLRQHGGLENLQVVNDHPKPKAVAGAVVIRVRASSFNYHDVFTVKGINMEKQGVVPDVIVDTHPVQIARGIDAQLNKAVEMLQGEVAEWKKKKEGAVPTGNSGSPPPPPLSDSFLSFPRATAGFQSSD